MTVRTTCAQADRPPVSAAPSLRAEMKWELRGDRWSSCDPRLSIGARVGAYRTVLVASHQHGMLKRKARLTARLASNA
jgi:hypothetical protein